MKFSKIKSHAKINLSLNVIGKLQSKLHKIESLVSFIKLHDLISIRPIKSKKHKVFFTGKFSKGISKKNSASNLLWILDEKNFLNEQKYEIKIEKNIPQQSGMGGGSMNAASLIDYFIKKKKIKLNKKKINNLANQIGSDVILGIDPKNTILFSNNKIIKIKKKLNYHILITKPNFGCSTKFIYSKVKSYSKSNFNHIKYNFLSKKNIINLRNDLEKIAFKKYPKLKKLKSFLSNLPNVAFVRMSGSGSSIAAYFHSKRNVDIATKEFKRKFNSYWYNASKTV